MSRRSSSTNRVDSGISRKIGSDLSKVIIVADNIDAVLAAASVDLEALLDALTEATDFAGITVVPGENAHWDPVTKVLTVPTVKGDKGDTGEDLRIISITPHTGGSFIWEFSDGTTYTTPNLRGNKGDQGDQGDKGDSVELTSIDYQGEGVFVWSFSDGTVYQTPSLKGVKGDQGDQGDKGDQGDPITMEASIYQGDGSFLWKFSDGSTYRTPNLRGVRGFKGEKGDKGDQGVSVHHLKGTHTTQNEGDFGVDGETDTYTFYGDPHETIVLGWFKIRNGYNTKGHADTAEENSALAEKWASEAVDVPVKDGKYSAYHHAIKAGLSAGGAALSAGEAALSVDEAALSAVAAETAANRAENAADQVEQDAEQIALDAAQQAASATIAGVDGQIAVAESAAGRAESAAAAAESSEGAAANSASTATDAASTAVTASGEAEATLKDFRERYYGKHATAPTTDPYGGAIEYGDLYFNTTYSELMVWASVDGEDVWKYAGLGPKGDRGSDFGIDARGLMSERQLYDDAPKYFTYFAEDQLHYSDNPPYVESFEHDPIMSYELSQPIGGPKSISVTLNGVIQSPISYVISQPTLGTFVLDIETEEGDTIVVREFAPAFVYGAVYFKLSNDIGDWSDAIPFNQGPNYDRQLGEIENILIAINGGTP